MALPRGTLMRSLTLSLIAAFSVSTFADPKLNLLIGNNFKGSCREDTARRFKKVRNSYAFSPNELIITTTGFSDSLCKQSREIIRYKLTCVFSESTEYAHCEHTGRGKSSDGVNWETIPVEDSQGLPIDPKIMAKITSAKKQLRITLVRGVEKPFVEPLGK
jgi:hypothetical protein